MFTSQVCNVLHSNTACSHANCDDFIAQLVAAIATVHERRIRDMIGFVVQDLVW
ncbi:hypothetical protein [Cohnella kolymensis]|uniref:hypothetical protein n=1 Tax=Cohnella kolymensis TaxID=1590652 RepID=UPI00137918E3|nr:hypothetical protein [Cohnella kolymensis]